jgi:hypothetical protein
MASPIETFKALPALQPILKGGNAIKDTIKKGVDSVKEDYKAITSPTTPSNIPDLKTIRNKAKEILKPSLRDKE